MPGQSSRYRILSTGYLTGPFSVGGEGIGTAGDLPENLQVLVAVKDGVTLSGEGDFFALIYAPESPVSLSGEGAFFGGLVEDTLTVSGRGGLHYDEAWGRGGRGAENQVQLISWRDVGGGGAG